VILLLVSYQASFLSIADFCASRFQCMGTPLDALQVPFDYIDYVSVAISVKLTVAVMEATGWVAKD
jgi:hypothetical protein